MGSTTQLVNKNRTRAFFMVYYRGTVPWDAIGRSNGSKLEFRDVKSFSKNVVNCHTFKDFNLNVSAHK